MLLDADVLLRTLAGSIAVVTILGFGVAAAFRATFPYPLEVQEDTAVQVLRRLAEGQPIYAEPTLDYVAAVYPPLYFQLSYIVAQVAGVGMLPLRLVSLMASLGALALVYALVRRETGIAALGLVGAGVFAASTELSLHSLDLARVDALGVFLILGALFAMRSADLGTQHESYLAGISGLCAGLAVATKQPNATVAALLLAYAAWSPWARLAPFAAMLVLGAATPIGLAYMQSGEWTRFFLIDLVRQHGFDDQHISNFWSVSVFPRFTLPLVLGPLFLMGRAAARQFRTVVFYGLATVGLVALAWGGWANQDSSANVYEPAFAILSILFALGIAEALHLLRWPRPGPDLIRRYFMALALAQFAILGYNPRSTIPPRSDIWAGDRLTAQIAALPGRVFAPRFGEWSLRAGKGSQPSVSGIMELAGSYGGQSLPPGQAYLDQLSASLVHRDFNYVLWERQSEAFALKNRIEAAGYVDIGPLFPANDLFDQWKTSYTPDVEVYIPKERVSGAS